MANETTNIDLSNAAEAYRRLIDLWTSDLWTSDLWTSGYL